NIVPGLGDPVEKNPIAGSFLFTPPPTSFVVDARISREQSDDQLTFNVTSSSRARVDALITMDTTASRARQETRATLNQIPTTMSVHFLRQGLGALQVNYQGDATIGDFAFSDKRIPDTNAPTTYKFVSADVRNIPQRVTYTLTPPFALAYSSSSNVGPATVSIEDYANNVLQKRMYGSATQLPTTVNVNAAISTTSTQATYTASSAIPRIDLAYFDRANALTTATSTILNIPTSMTVTLAQQTITFVANAPVGTITAAVSRNGGSAGTDSRDHVILNRNGAALGADLKISGVKEFTIDPANGGHYRLVLSPGGQQFVASATIDNGQFATAVISNLPSTMDVTVNLPSQVVTWTASAVINSVAVQARAISGRTWDATLLLTGIPAQWDVSFASDHPLFRGITGPLGSVSATLTNHGTFTTFSGNHASAVFRGATGDLDASFRMTAINHAEMRRTIPRGGGTGSLIDLQMGGGQSFYVNADFLNGTSKALLQATVNPLPTSIQLSQANDAFGYNANTNFDLSAYAEVGDTAGVAAAPSPPSVRGISVRDGAGCDGCAAGIKARVFIEGFPTGFSADASSRTYSVTNFKPPGPLVICIPFCISIPRDFLVLDVDLTVLTPTPTKVLAVQNGIPSPVSITFGPITQENLADGKRTTVLYTATGNLGAFTADVVMGSAVGRLEISNIPASINVQMKIGNPTSTVSITNSAPISRIF
ncbi:MAG TPA: hypothetical protein VFG86_09555, partial [Chloroflexota bacterium]|nr:hypothetical protein [Chloroflexota bacterium]